MAAETNWGMLCPSNELVEKSYLVDPKPYFERFFLINKFRSDISSNLYVWQNGKCSLCEQALLEELHQEESNFSNWTYNLDIDHTIPLSLAGNSQKTNLFYLRELNKNINVSLMHKECHKFKTRYDKSFIYDLKQKFNSKDDEKWTKAILELCEADALKKRMENIYLSFNPNKNLTRVDSLKRIGITTNNLKLISKDTYIERSNETNTNIKLKTNIARPRRKNRIKVRDNRSYYKNLGLSKKEFKKNIRKY